MPLDQQRPEQALLYILLSFGIEKSRKIVVIFVALYIAKWYFPHTCAQSEWSRMVHHFLEFFLGQESLSPLAVPFLLNVFANC